MTELKLNRENLLIASSRITYSNNHIVKFSYGIFYYQLYYTICKLLHHFSVSPNSISISVSAKSLPENKRKIKSVKDPLALKTNILFLSNDFIEDICFFHTSTFKYRFPSHLSSNTLASIKNEYVFSF